MPKSDEHVRKIIHIILNTISELEDIDRNALNVDNLDAAENYLLLANEELYELLGG